MATEDLPLFAQLEQLADKISRGPMPTIANATSIPANATVNVIAGSQYEFIPYPATVEIGIKCAATGLVATVYSGPDVLQEEAPVTVKGVANELPIYPDDFGLEDEAAPGDRLTLRVRNTTGGALTANWAVRISALAA